MYAPSSAPASTDDVTEATAGGNAAREREHEIATALDSVELLRGEKSVAIRHNGAIYRLQATKLGKLILTK